MLTISKRALRVIQRVTDHELLDGRSGVRIATARRRQGRWPLAVGAVNGPDAGDHLVERPGARLYVSPEAVDRVEGCELDARTDDEDRVQFVLRR